MPEIDLSIIIVSYNHEKYITEALNSVLMQEIEFEYEILFADDASTDSTQKIIKQNSTNLMSVQYLFRTENVGNSKNTFEAIGKCNGKYIIILEGDDYWYSKNKLQTQYDYLENNPDYIAVSDLRAEIDAKGSITTVHPNWQKGDTDITIEHILNHKFYSTIEAMFRNVYSTLFSKPDIERLFKLDRMIYDAILLFLFPVIGKVRMLNIIGGIYRTGISSGNTTNYNATKNIFDMVKDRFHIYQKLEEFFKHEYSFKRLYAQSLFQCSIYSIRNRNFADLREIKKTVNEKYIRYYHRIYVVLFLKHIVSFVKRLGKAILR